MISYRLHVRSVRMSKPGGILITSRFGPWTIGPTPSRLGPASRSIWPSATWFILALLFIYISCYKYYNTKRFWAILGAENKHKQKINNVKSLPPGPLPYVLALSHLSLSLGQASLSKPLTQQMPSPCWFDKWNWLREPDRHSGYSAPSYVAIIFIL